MKLRVLTMNLFSHHRDWNARRAVVVDGLAALSPDVVVLQEAVVDDTSDQVAEILGSEYHVFHQRGRSPDGSGASLASRWPISPVREADLHVTDGGDSTGWIGSLAVVEIAAPPPIGQFVVAHHKPTWQSGAEAERERQAFAAAAVIEEIAPEPDRRVILAGDFDATPDAASVRFWTGRQSLSGSSVYYQDCWTAVHGDAPGFTFAPGGIRSDRWRPRPARRIDYVMVRCGPHGAPLDITGCDLAFNEPVGGVWASDHFAVYADFVTPPSTSDPP